MKFLAENRNKRRNFLPARGKALPTPIYFPSISSVKTALSPINYLNILQGLGQSHFLVSAYDIDRSFQREEFIETLQKNIKNNGPIILMDSGNYESWWMRDKNWDINSFNSILRCDVSDLAFCFDNQMPSDNLKANIEEVKRSTFESQIVSKTSSIIPIVHCSKEKLIEAVLELHSKTNSEIISVPERILGEGLVERISTVTNLRKALNRLENYCYIHLLGTGNPFSLLLFSLAGADSFDGLEWCQTVVNSKTSLLYHFQQRELIRDECVFCNSDLDYHLATLGHNLNFYKNWMIKIQNAFESKTEDDLLKEWFDPNFIETLHNIWF